MRSLEFIDKIKAPKTFINITVTNTISISYFLITDINTAKVNKKKNGPHKSQFFIFALNSSLSLFSSITLSLTYINFISHNIVSLIDSLRVLSILVLNYDILVSTDFLVTYSISISSMS